ncbi:MAG: methylated-DNA--[protein]-cysteine S-methyltransferase, partial [Gammaproteobacteria bacterium]|nr:methylated-DNA--[protein]-cysteine S-methyltransferase [Gammaproteobacteria bacterium]
MQKITNQPLTESAVIKTPFAKLELVFESGVLVAVDLFSRKKLLLAESDEAKYVCQQVNDYCSKPLPHLAFDIELQTKGTLFQKKVWQALQEIPAGQVVTYG